MNIRETVHRFWRRLSVRLIVSHVLVALVVMMVALGITGFTVRRYLIDDQLSTLVTRAEEISPAALDVATRALYNRPALLVIQVLEGTLRARMGIYTNQGTLVILTSEAPLTVPRSVLAGVARNGQNWQGLVKAKNQELAAAVIPLVENQQMRGIFVMETPLSGATKTAWSVISLVFWGELVAVLLAVLVAYSFSRRLSWPLVSLRRSVAEMGPDRWREPIELDGPLEVEELAGEFNQMQERIHQQMVNLEQEKAKRDALLGHVTHDLRTPLTSIRGFLEAIGDGVVDGEGKARAVDIALEETLRLQRLVNRLLEATRIQSRTAPKFPVPVDRWVEDTLERLGPVAASKGVALTWERPLQSSEVSGVRDHLVEALMNVIDNAIKWAPVGSSVEVGAEITKTQVSVSVRDHGPGIAPDILPRVLDRFVTGDPSRTDSSGLGLSIVADVMEEHGGYIRVENHPDGGAVVALVLPLPHPDEL